jgi:hypothetical protein
MSWNRAGARFACSIVAIGIICGRFADPAAGQGAFPARLDSYFTKVLKLSPQERQALLAARPVAKNLDADPAKEVAVFGAIWIDAPAAKYVAALKDIENFEKGAGFRREIQRPLSRGPSEEPDRLGQGQIQLVSMDR